MPPALGVKSPGLQGLPSGQALSEALGMQNSPCRGRGNSCDLRAGEADLRLQVGCKSGGGGCAQGCRRASCMQVVQLPHQGLALCGLGGGKTMLSCSLGREPKHRGPRCLSGWRNVAWLV